MSAPTKSKKGFNLFGHFLSQNEIFRFGLVLSNIILIGLTRIQSIRLTEQSEQIENLTVMKAYLLSEKRGVKKAMNKTPLAWWEKELYPESDKIVVVDYNDAFYDYILKPMNLSRYEYIRKTDHDFFPEDIADTFYQEDMMVITKYLSQKKNENGERPIFIKEFNTPWIDTSGNLNQDGYWRWAIEVDGHFYIYGMLKKPRKNKKVIINLDPVVFIKPEKLQVPIKKKNTKSA